MPLRSGIYRNNSKKPVELANYSIAFKLEKTTERQ